MFLPFEKAEADMFEKTSSEDNFSPQFRYSKTKNKTDNKIILTNNDNHIINIPFNQHEIHDALIKCNSKNSTGHDGIPYIFIKQLSNRAISIILKIFNVI